MKINFKRPKNVLFSLALMASTTLSGGILLAPVAAHALSATELPQIVELFINLGIIPADKAEQARSAVTTNAGGGGGSTFCHTFNTNLGIGAGRGIGSEGEEIQALQQALRKEGFNPDTPGDDGFPSFGENLAAAVTGFQEKYRDEILTPNGLRYGTGFVGRATRAKLNSLYGCGVTPPIILPPIPPFPPLPPLPGEGVVRNPGFESDFYTSNDWVPDALKGGCEFTNDTAVAHSGLRSAKIRCADINHARWIQSVPVQPNTNYILTGWIKTQDVANTREVSNVGANLVANMNTLAPNDWTYQKVLFNSGDKSSVTIGASLGTWGGMTTGTAWFDDIQLTTSGGILPPPPPPGQTPSITVLSPNGGETWQVGSTQTVRWSGGLPNWTVAVDLRSTPTSQGVQTSPNIPNSGSYTFTVSPNVLPGRYYIYVVCQSCPVGTQGAGDWSDSSFSIVAAGTIQPSITVLYPNGGEQLTMGSKSQIRWLLNLQNPLAGEKIKVLLIDTRQTTSPWGLRDWEIPFANSSGIIWGGESKPDWTVGDARLIDGGSPPPSGSSYKIRVCILTSGGFTLTSPICDDSNSTFSIVPAGTVQPSITVLSPNGGETLAAGTVQSARWSGGGSNWNLNVMLQNSSGVTLRVLTATPSVNDGIEPWT
ncbi:MAG: hypothetical protein HYT34_00995, partial [Candidatus Ryanbacteria bacterium]|nr:hypothetical protein [Candidatus Ryanbacteria bacterium]